MKPVVAIDANATEHIIHRQGIGLLKYIHVANLWIHDEVSSTRLRVCRVQSEENVLSKAVIARADKTWRCSWALVPIRVFETRTARTRLVTMPNTSNSSSNLARRWQVGLCGLTRTMIQQRSRNLHEVVCLTSRCTCTKENLWPQLWAARSRCATTQEIQWKTRR